MFLLHFFLFFTAAAALLRNPKRCFYKTVGSKDREAVGYARNSSITTNQAECFKMCLLDRKCRFLAFNDKTNRCALNPRIGSKLSLSADVLGFAFRKVCLDEFFEGEPLRDAPLRGNPCFERTPGKVLIGVVDQLVQDIATVEQCEELCATVNSDKDASCKSVMYYPKEKECIVAAQTRKEMPELFTDDQNAIYIESVCPGGKSAPFASTDNFSEKIAVRPPISEAKDYGSELDPFESPKTHAPVKIESSGYDTGVPSIAPHFPAPMPHAPSTHSPLIIVPDTKPHESVLTHSETRKIESPTMIEPKVIDSYNVNPKKTATVDIQSYRRRLRDPKINKCFNQIFAKDVVNERVLRSHSMEQCIDICRLCENCLHGRKCNRVAFSIVNRFCALGSTLIVSQTAPHLSDSAFVQYKRSNC